MSHLSILRRLAVAAVVVLPLTSCYIPDKFRSELRLSRFGDYALTFTGDLIYAPILNDYAEGKITPDNETEKNENIYKDLVRDPAIKDLKRSGKGRFAIKYERTGHLDKVQLVAFTRRDARMLSLKSNEDGTIIVQGNMVKTSDAQRMVELGIDMQGEFRITTDAHVLRHNATDVRTFGQSKVYVWKIENPLSPTPSLVILRDPSPARPTTP